MLSELLRIIAQHEKFYSDLGFKSRNDFEKATGKLPEIRNQVMHPVRPLIYDGDSCLRLESALKKAIIITERIKNKLKAIG